jgi:hypothetical protein
VSISGIEGLSVDEIRARVGRGARFVVFPYAISLLVVTFRRSSAVQFIDAGQSALVKGIPYLLISLFLGWWGFPWGFIYTPMSIIETLSGGKDVTAEVMNALA